MSDNKIKSKIAALLAKAQGTDNEHEAEAFLAKVNELLDQHQLDMGDIVDADDPVKHHKGLQGTPSHPSWQRHLYRDLGKLYGCQSVFVSDYEERNGKWRDTFRQELVGRESAIITTEMMYPWVKAECNRLGRGLAKQSGQTPAYETRRVANALVTRIRTLIVANQTKNDAPKTKTARNSLVTLDRVQQVMAQVYGETQKAARRGTRTNANAREAAAGIGLHRQTGGKSQLKLGNG